jgi:glucose/arabinose dehydrogenase
VRARLLASLAATAAVAVLAAPAPAGARIGLKRVVGGLDAPVYVTVAPGVRRRLFVVEQGGRIVVVRHGRVARRPLLDISSSISSGGERGLLSVAFDPGFRRNHRFFVDYTNREGNTRVVSFRTSRAYPFRADPRTRRIWLKVHQPFANHNGGQLQFRGHWLYVGMGDGGSAGDPQGKGQNRRSRLGKILRMRVDVPRPRGRMYAYGLRNPWRFSFDRSSGGLWIGDVGQNRYEEIDHLRARARPGANLGWNAYEGRHLFRRQRIDRSRLVFPVAEYSHAGGSCSVTGGYVYRGPIRRLRGWYVYADFCSGRIWRLRARTRRVREMAISRRLTQISSFGENARGDLYVVSLAGSVYRLVGR